MTTEERPPIDTRLRTQEEIMIRMINPVPVRHIAQKTDQSKADFVNVTTRKDILDWVCGFGRWRAEVVSQMEAGNRLGMIVRLHIQTSDEGWISQDGTGEEVTNNPKIFGDPWSNAYAQGLARAAESFGLARELWRRDKKTKQPQITRAQEAAHRWVKEHPDGPTTEDIPVADPEPGEGDEYDQRPPAPAASSGTSGSSRTARAASSTTASESPQPAPTTTANKKPEELTAADLRAMQAEPGPLADQSIIKQLRAATRNLPKFDLDSYCENTLKVEVGNLKLAVAVALIARAHASKQKKQQAK